MWNLRNKTNEQKKMTNKPKQTFSYRQQTVVARGKVDGQWVKYIKEIESMLILMSTEKCIGLLKHYTVPLKLI